MAKNARKHKGKKKGAKKGKNIKQSNLSEPSTQNSKVTRIQMETPLNSDLGDQNYSQEPKPSVFGHEFYVSMGVIYLVLIFKLLSLILA